MCKVVEEYGDERAAQAQDLPLEKVLELQKEVIPKA